MGGCVLWGGGEGGGGGVLGGDGGEGGGVVEGGLERRGEDGPGAEGDGEVLRRKGGVRA